MNCDSCNQKNLGTTYSYWDFNLCPKCNGSLLDINVPLYIPDSQIWTYKIKKLKKINESYD
jgi:hypothetical protein